MKKLPDLVLYRPLWTLRDSSDRKLHFRLAIPVTIAVFLLLFPALNGLAGDIPNRDGIYDPDIRTVQLFKEGFELSAPVIGLNSNEKLLLSFDDLNYGLRRFRYTIRHCNSEWATSSGIGVMDYIDGYEEDNIDRFEYSYNTTVKYIHYSLEFPTGRTRPKISGNYLLIVFTEDSQEYCFTRRFMVVESTPVVATGNVIQGTRMEDRDRTQQVDLQVMLNGFRVNDIAQEIKVVVQQNGRWDNALIIGKPRFIRGDVLDYRHDENITLQGGNQFRSFDTKSLVYQSERIAKMIYDTITQVYLLPDIPRSFKQYVFENDINGRFYIKNEEHAQNSNTEADYTLVHFFLPWPALATGGQFFILGELTLWEMDDNSRMHFNFARKGYELNLLLKQGYYNYLLVFKEDNKLPGDESLIEGSHWETENDYSVYVYFRETGALYDRLIAVNFLNSVQK